MQIWPNHIGQESLEAREKARREARQKTLPGPPNGGAAAGGESLTAAMDESVQPPTPSARAQLDGEAEARLLERFPLFFQTYGYA